MDLKPTLGAVAGLPPFLARAALSAITLIALARVWWLVLYAPHALFIETISITLAPGQSVDVQRSELGLRGAGQLTLRRDTAGRWMIRGPRDRADIKLRLAPDGPWEPLNAVPLMPGRTIGIGRQRLMVEAVSPTLRLVANDQEWQYDGTTLVRNGSPLPLCGDNISARIASQWTAVAPGWLTPTRPLELGGVAACDNRIPLAEASRRTALITPTHDGFGLQAGNAWDAVTVCTDLVIGQCPFGSALSDLEAPLEKISDVLAGRSAFRVALLGSNLTLHPHRPGMRIAAIEAAEAAPQLSREIAPRDRWHLPERAIRSTTGGAIVGLLVATVLGIRHGRTHRRLPLPTVQMLLVTVSAAWIGVAIGGKASDIDLGWACAAVSMSAAVLGIVGQAWRKSGSATVLWWGALATIGLALQLELGIAAPHGGGMKGFGGGAMVLSLAVATALAARSAWTMLPARDWTVLHAERGLMLLIVVALCGLAAQAIFGGEGGVWGVQPVELAKLALVAGTAHALALHYTSSQAKLPSSAASRWFFTILPVALLVALVTSALVIVDDYSPLVLLGFSIAGVVSAVLVVARRLVVLIFFLLLSIALVALIDVNRADIAHLASQGGIYADRMQVWQDPSGHPHTGEQFLRGRLLGLDGGLWGTTGLAEPGEHFPWSVPAVQDDFAPSYLVHRYGTVGGLIVLLLQAGALAGLLVRGLQKHEAGLRAGYRSRWLSLWAFFCLWGGTGYLIGHWVVSWGMNVGFLPVMGQPMTLISAAGSHLLLFLYPLIMIASLPVGAPAREGA